MFNLKYIFLALIFKDVYAKNKWYKKLDSSKKSKKLEIFRRFHGPRTGETSCGDVSSNFPLGAGVSYSCEDNVCTMTCDGETFPFPSSTIICNLGVFSPAATTPIDCKSTQCGDPVDWGFGDEYLNMDVTCGQENSRSLAICNVDCTVNGNPGFSMDMDGNEFTTIVCQDDGTLLPAASSITLQCAETPCGALADDFTMGNVTSSCSETGCSFSCANPSEMPSYTSIQCNGEYQHVHGSDSNAIDCIQAKETPCGDPSEYFTYNENVDIVCDPFESFYQSSETTCAVTCKNDLVLVGDDTLRCENGNFQNSNTALTCKETACGNVNDTFTVDSDVTVTCDDNECSMGCSTGGEMALVESVVCNITSGQFIDVVLWPSSPNPMTNPTLSCDVREETMCGNGNQFTNVSAGTVIQCDYDTSCCHLSCDDTLPFHAQPNIQSTQCNPNTQMFSILFDTPLNCELYAVRCGNLHDNFDLGSGVVTTCVYDEEQGADVCSLTCEDPALVVSGHSEITCTHGWNTFNVPTGTSLTCVPPPETSCGYLADHYNIDSSVGDLVCNDHQCFYSCDDELDYLALSLVQCVSATKRYFPADGDIKCEKGFDTGCGDIITTGNSVKSCANNTCTFSCPDGKILHGIQSATCNIYGGTRAFTYETNFNAGEDFYPLSECADTMCGDTGTINLQVDNSVTINTGAVTTDGYGSISFECSDDKVISGLHGQSAIACLPNGHFDVLYPAAAVSCSDTSCGNLEGTLTVHTDVNTTCTGDTCKFHCPAGSNGITVSPSMPSVICDTATGTFLTSEHTVECMNSCEPFGNVVGGYKIADNVMVFCDKYRPGQAQYCDLICQRPLHALKPIVRETQQKLEKIKCEKNKNGVGKWQSVVYDMIGLPRAVKIASNTAVHNVICEKGEQIFVEDVQACDYIHDAYQIDEQVAIKCTPEICLFACPVGHKLNTNINRVLCKARDGITSWYPPHAKMIACEKEKGEKTSDKATAETPTTKAPKTKGKKNKEKKNKKNKKVSSESSGDGGEEVMKTCGDPKVASGVVSNCSGSKCTFSCESVNQIPNATAAKCKNGKWKFSPKTKKVSCSDDPSREDAPSFGENTILAM